MTFIINDNQVCWYFLNQQCRFGSNCRFVHPDVRIQRPNDEASDKSSDAKSLSRSMDIPVAVKTQTVFRHSGDLISRSYLGRKGSDASSVGSAPSLGDQPISRSSSASPGDSKREAAAQGRKLPDMYDPTKVMSCQRIAKQPDIKIGILRQSAEVLPILEAES